MKVSVVTRSGRELVKGGLELNDSVRFIAFLLSGFFSFMPWFEVLNWEICGLLCLFWLRRCKHLVNYYAHSTFALV